MEVPDNQQPYFLGRLLAIKEQKQKFLLLKSL
jgi:hypothetical protein